MCDGNNQVFDLNLNFVHLLAHVTKEVVNSMNHLMLDTAGNIYIYVTDFKNSRVQVLDNSGHFIRTLGDEGERKLGHPTSGLHIADKYVYISICHLIWLAW